MTTHIALHHQTNYQYSNLIQIEPQVVRLRPAPHCRSKIISYSLKVEPTEHFINWQQDPFANYQARLVFPKKTKHFTVTVDLIVEMAVYNPFDFFLEPEAHHYPFKYKENLKSELTPYLVQSKSNPLLLDYFTKIDRRKKRTIDFVVGINQQLQKDIQYLIRLEPGVQSPDETLLKKCGSCRDSAWLLVNLFRLCGLAARFVSGYLIQLKADVQAIDGPSGTDKDFTDLHAWCEVFLPGAGWVGLDPTSGLLAGEGHIPLACTPAPSNAAPIEGVIEACEVQFEHHMEIHRIYESPRVTKPYADDEWQHILELGHLVDQQLIEQDVRLTMGGEPTFVAMNGADEPEWNTAAMGPTKRAYASQLTQKLNTQYSYGGILHCGQGKWYPGEQLPRWAFSLYWRTDKKPIWQDVKLFSQEADQAQYTQQDAKKLIKQLCLNLGLPENSFFEGKEDAWYYLWREAKLPIDQDVAKLDIDDVMERNRIRRTFNQGLKSSVGYALPLMPNPKQAKKSSPWLTCKWKMRDPFLSLIPGDSPMGYRLPLSSITFQASKSSSGKEYLASEMIRTTLCVEVRDSKRASGPEAENQGNGKTQFIYVFMPPLDDLDHYLDLLHIVEKTVASLQLKVVLEGYPPPRDPRLQVLQVTPDPGVIEVNIQPANNWQDIVAQTEFLYQCAFETKLSAEKFMMDGKHTGTGGGNHFVLGGKTVDDSPFLRKPELLASLLRYWHNHPSLSYLFSGLFIGPTSQSPRIDEARNDQIYELDIALKEIQLNQKKHGHKMPPWLVDRTLRNILIDVTGNTHRSEFCIDKLFSPDSSTGRLGLLELRSFEMPPHPRMSLTQQLFLRACVARFWKDPYQASLTRWGTELHDRFLLSNAIRQDFYDVIDEMNLAGFEFKKEWFAPHFEFRFPLIGRIDVMGVQLSLRNALEPWHVMGEETTGGGTARYVDSSIERIELIVSGINPHRHVITCNKIAVPLQTTGKVGEFVAGIRFKAWNPPSSLHPTIGVHSPLTFDIVDTWNRRSLGGCQYHVIHPGGVNYNHLPINSYEAESRRLSRFFAMGHTTGQLKKFPSTFDIPQSNEFPYTLDLRR
jgi:uncharacterized protein (DUF2126 family)/transglutaminase-like putative cysteine protease